MSRLPDHLLDRDARFLPPPPKLTDLALIRAARSSDVEAMRLLVEAGADPSLRDEKRGGITPLVAVMSGPELPQLIEAERQPTEEKAIAAIDFLLDKGANPSVGNALGTTALHTAALRDYPAVIKHMAERGVNLNVADSEGFTPLDYAVGRLPSKVRAKSPGPESAAAKALRELGAAREGRAKDCGAMSTDLVATLRRCSSSAAARRGVARFVREAVAAGTGRRARRRRQQVLHGLPQPSGARGRARAREPEPRGSRRAAREVGEGDPQAQRGAHAAARRAAAEQRSRREPRVLSRDHIRYECARGGRRAGAQAHARGVRQRGARLARLPGRRRRRCCPRTSRATASTTSRTR